MQTVVPISKSWSLMNTAVLTGRQVLFNAIFGICEVLALIGILTGVATNEDLHCVGGGKDR